MSRDSLEPAGTLQIELGSCGLVHNSLSQWMFGGLLGRSDQTKQFVRRERVAGGYDFHYLRLTFSKRTSLVEDNGL